MRALALWWTAVAVLLVLVETRTVYAHPLGNFTINHLAVLSARNGTLHVRYVLDIAEIPTFQIMHTSSLSGTWGATEMDRWAHREVARVAGGLTIDVDGLPQAIALRDVHARLRPGAGGLPILYWVADFTAPLTPGVHHVDVTDHVYSDRRIGWKDIVVAPQTEPTHELLVYPNAMIGSPRRVRAARFTLEPNGEARAIADVSDDGADAFGSTSIVRSNALTDMFSNPSRAPLFVAMTMLVAFGLGALHAIEPGHGKALMAVTLVGARATIKQAAILAASLTFAHTIGVFVLGLVLFSAAGFVSESIYPWITLVSGIAVAIIGARNLARYLQARGIHAHGEHAYHATGGHHGDGRESHSHVIPGAAPIDFRAAVVAAMSGGVAPCPAAIVVMLAALRLHQLGYGIFLIVIFSLGLALVLTGLGIAVVRGSAFVARSGRFDALVQRGPLISAALISLVGAVMIGQGFADQGVRAPVWLVAALVGAAIAGYALNPPHAHAHRAQTI
jgi:nickel/cobalt exporter